MFFSGTLLENLTYGITEASSQDLLKVLRAMDLEELVSSSPEGLNMRLEEGGSNLSGGQLQRISLARALLRHPRILILDEFTSALDSLTEAKIMESIGYILGKCTVIMVSHRLETVVKMDQIAVLKNGGIAELGSFGELMKKQGIFCRMYQHQDRT